MLAGALVGFTAFLFLPITLSVLAVVSVGVGKEMYDFIMNKISKKKVHDVEVMDAIATIVGGIIPIIIMNLLK